MSSGLKIAVLGATGIVGQEFIKILESGKYPVKELRPLASEKSAGDKMSFNGQNISITAPSPESFEGCDVSFFSAGAKISEQWAPIALSKKTFVIDNSSAFRMKNDISLVVPEVNAHRIPDRKNPAIIANPNCSTIQLVVALKPLENAFKLKNVTVATYQSVSGAGKAGVEELHAQTKEVVLDGKVSSKPSTFAHSIAFNNIPQIDVFDSTGFTFEEKKMMQETQKIMELPNLDISVTCVRTPTLNGHSEAVWVELEKETSRDEFVSVLKKAPGIVIQDDPSQLLYPLNANASGQDPVFVGRIRQDLKNKKRWLMWVVSDNVRKGAALNGIQIAEKIFSEFHK